MEKDNDYELLYFIHTNDEIAFRYLFHKYEKSIRYIIRKYQKRKDRRCCEDDLIQIARIKLLHAIQNYREDKETTFSYFYFEILEHCMIDYYRTRYSQKGAKEYMAISLDASICDQQAAYLTEMDHSDRYLEVCDRIKKRKRYLKPLEREIVDLRIEGYTYSQISDNLNIKQKKIDNTLRKMRKYE